MKRRSFLSMVAALPFAGKLVPQYQDVGHLPSRSFLVAAGPKDSRVIVLDRHMEIAFNWDTFTLKPLALPHPWRGIHERYSASRLPL